MITFLRGKLIEALPTQATVEVHGVGYEVLIPLSSFDKLPAPGSEVHLLTHLAIREDAHVLYGFMTAAERDIFRLLIHTVSGIGPKIALNVLSGMNPAALRGAVANSDVKALSQISGVGKKTAERIVVELRDKIGAAGAWEDRHIIRRRRRWRIDLHEPCSLGQGAAMRILVVDDNRDILDLVQRVLLTFGYDVVIARDGLEAIQQESIMQPDLVVLDVNLPTLDGWEVCRRIKARRDVPVMLLTVRAERADLERSHDAGADDHLPKPFDIAEFLKRINQLVARAVPTQPTSMP